MTKDEHIAILKEACQNARKHQLFSTEVLAGVDDSHVRRVFLASSSQRESFGGKRL